MELDGLTVHDLHPPAEVVAAYHDVARAIQARDQQINQAEAQATQLRKQAEEEALRELAEAEAARRRRSKPPRPAATRSCTGTGCGPSCRRTKCRSSRTRRAARRRSIGASG